MRKAAVAVAAVLVLTGCAAPAPEHDDTLHGTIAVFAAASLTDTFQTIAAAFSAQHPGVTVTINAGGSSGLAAQIVAGAPADVFAAASVATMKVVTDAALTATEPTVFATNTLEIAVPVDNPGHVSGLADFADPALAIALCAPEVPCGAAARSVLDTAGIVASVDTLEPDVRAVLTKVELGEVDAGLVYRTDVLAAGNRVRGIEFAEAATVVTAYPIARLSASTNPDAAAAFVAFVHSAAARAILEEAGFGAP
ncbi:MAG: molybdate ABC transporter substrate-binding protein [Salinibacterium sp.]|nr:molybdate ABC transporter substrate-binding protein [Salinibacterium sp.]